jgi:hypothetical protein
LIEIDFSFAGFNNFLRLLNPAFYFVISTPAAEISARRLGNIVYCVPGSHPKKHHEGGMVG